MFCHVHAHDLYRSLVIAVSVLQDEPSTIHDCNKGRNMQVNSRRELMMHVCNHQGQHETQVIIKMCDTEYIMLESQEWICTGLSYLLKHQSVLVNSSQQMKRLPPTATEPSSRSQRRRSERASCPYNEVQETRRHYQASHIIFYQ